MQLPFANFSLDSLSERDRRTLKIGGGVAALLLLYVIIQLDSSVSSAHKRILKKQADLTWMRANGPELAQVGHAPGGGGQESLLVIVDRSARESGLASALAGSDPAGPGALSIRLQKAAFDSLVPWLYRLSQQNGIRVDTASIESAGSPGLVNASIVLHMD
jgi:type II secretory pathway component PulM